MAEVAMLGHHDHSDSADSLSSLAAPAVNAAPMFTMARTPDFAFPNVPRSSAQNNNTNMAFEEFTRRRPVSAHLGVQSRVADPGHKRGVSALPSFSFNAADATGLHAEQPDFTETTPSRGRHQRNTSELVGGNGINGAISSSPTRTSARRRREKRITLSSHDLSSIMSPAEREPRLSNSLPNTPVDDLPQAQPPQTPSAFTRTPDSADDVFTSTSGQSFARPPSRPRVEFSDNVEYIPRPLSTISSETGSSLSTLRSHSVNNSISSMLSLGTPSPPSMRARAISLETTFEDDSAQRSKPVQELNKVVEKEGQWLKRSFSGDDLARPVSAPAPAPQSPTLTFTASDSPLKHRQLHKKRQSLSYALGFDRRKSEPLLGAYTGESSCLSALSLQESGSDGQANSADEDLGLDQRSSSRKLKDWAISKLSRKVKPHTAYLTAPDRREIPSVSPTSEPAEAETDLDMVFNLDSEDATAAAVRSQPRVEMGASNLDTRPSFGPFDADDGGTVLDLDAALGPFKTPPMGSLRPRRELHSSRGTRDFAGPGGHYLPIHHRRTESAPMLTPFDHSSATPSQGTFADVLVEEDEEDDLRSSLDEEAGTGVRIVDSDMSAGNSTSSFGDEEGLRIQHGGAWEPERPSTSYGTLNPRLSTSLLDRRASSVIEDTILEESSPVEPTIVEAHEEPRAQSLAKSSDSSDTPTILAAQTDMLGLPESQQSLTTPESYQYSAFSSPDFAHRQNSFDTTRIGTSASSVTDNRTMSSCATGEALHDSRVSVDDTPSLTSSRSTMLSTAHPNSSRREFSGARTPSMTSGTADAGIQADRRAKRGSIQSLSQLMGNSFGSRTTGMGDKRPQTATDSLTVSGPRRKEHRLKKLMFWKSKHRQASTSTIS